METFALAIFWMLTAMAMFVLAQLTLQCARSRPRLRDLFSMLGMTGALICGVLLSLLTAAHPAITVLFGITTFGVIQCILMERSRARVVQLLKMAPLVTAVGLRRFDSLTSAKYGVITADELSNCIDSRGLDAADRALLVHMNEHIHEIGHVVDTLEVEEEIVTGIGCPPMMTPVVVKVRHNVYGISKADLCSYHSRVSRLPHF
jgi:hypothetical protein